MHFNLKEFCKLTHKTLGGIIEFSIVCSAGVAFILVWGMDDIRVFGRQRLFIYLELTCFLALLSHNGPATGGYYFIGLTDAICCV